WPLWFAMDFQGTAGKEITALQTRQQYLGTLTEQKRCGEAPVGQRHGRARRHPQRSPRLRQWRPLFRRYPAYRQVHWRPDQLSLAPPAPANGVIPGYDKQPISPGLDSSLSSRGR